MNSRNTPDDLERAVLFMMAAALALPAINACAKFLSDFSVIQVTWARYLGHFLFMVVAFAPRHGLAMFRSNWPTLQFARSALHCSSAVMTFTAVAFVPLATATTIGFLAPLIVTALAPILLREHVGYVRWSAVLVGFAGAIVALRPGWGVEHEGAVLLLVGNAIASAFIQIMSRQLASRDPPMTSNTYMVLIGFVLMSLPLPFVWRSPVEPVDILVFVLIGIFGGAGHYFLVSAFEKAPAAFVSPFSYGQLVGAILLGYVIFGQLPDLWSWVGSAIIVGSGIFILLSERRKRPAGRG